MEKMISDEDYILHFKLRWKLFGLALAVTPIWIVWESLAEDGGLGLLEWFVMACFPFVVVGGVFLPFTQQTHVTKDGIFAKCYIGFGHLRVWERIDELYWHEVFSVHEGFTTILPNLSPTVVFFAGLHKRRTRRILIGSMQKGYEEALVYALSQVQPKVVDANVRKVFDSLRSMIDS